jgi:hypothetical protein
MHVRCMPAKCVHVCVQGLYMHASEVHAMCEYVICMRACEQGVGVRTPSTTELLIHVRNKKQIEARDCANGCAKPATAA